MANRFATMVTAILMVVLSVLLTFPVAAAEIDRGDARYNIAIVVDASGSLGLNETADPAENRYGALSYFLGLLDTNGHEIGALVFNDSTVSPSSEITVNSHLKFHRRTGWT